MFCEYYLKDKTESSDLQVWKTTVPGAEAAAPPIWAVPLGICPTSQTPGVWDSQGKGAGPQAFASIKGFPEEACGSVCSQRTHLTQQIANAHISQSNF